MTHSCSSRLYAAARGYSLIELLAAAAILSVLAGLTVGSLSPVKASALTVGGNQIADLLASARQNSLSRQAFTAVVIKSAGDARYSAHCLFELTRNEDGNFEAWRMVAPWRLLPEGVRFDPNAPIVAPAANFLETVSTLPAPLPDEAQFRGKAINLARDAAYQVFAPDGTLTKGEPTRLRLVQAAEDAGAGIIYTGQRSANGPANYYDIVILHETGHVKVERL